MSHGHEHGGMEQTLSLFGTATRMGSDGCAACRNSLIETLCVILRPAAAEHRGLRGFVKHLESIRPPADEVKVALEKIEAEERAKAEEAAAAERKAVLEKIAADRKASRTRKAPVKR